MPRHPSHPSLHKASQSSTQASNWTQSTSISNELRWTQMNLEDVRQEDRKKVFFYFQFVNPQSLVLTMTFLFFDMAVKKLYIVKLAESWNRRNFSQEVWSKVFNSPLSSLFSSANFLQEYFLGGWNWHFLIYFPSNLNSNIPEYSQIFHQIPHKISYTIM